MPPSPTILCVDDDKLNRWSLCEKIAEQFGVQPEQADCVDAMLAKVAKRSFDLILLDITIPGRSGVEGLDRDERGQREADLVGVAERRVSPDHSALLQPPDALMRSRHGQPGPLGQFGEAHPPVGGQQRDDGAVDLFHPVTVAVPRALPTLTRLSGLL